MCFRTILTGDFLYNMSYPNQLQLGGIVKAKSNNSTPSSYKNWEKPVEFCGGSEAVGEVLKLRKATSE